MLHVRVPSSCAADDGPCVGYRGCSATSFHLCCACCVGRFSTSSKLRAGVRRPHVSDDCDLWLSRKIQARVLLTTSWLVVMGRSLLSSNCADEAQNSCCPWWLMLLAMIADTCNSSRPYRSIFDVWTCLNVNIQGACPLDRGNAQCDGKTSTSPLTAEVKFEILPASGDWWCLQFLGAFTVSRLASGLAPAQWHSDPVRVFPRLVAGILMLFDCFTTVNESNIVYTLVAPDRLTSCWCTWFIWYKSFIVSNKSSSLDWVGCGWRLPGSESVCSLSFNLSHSW